MTHSYVLNPNGLGLKDVFCQVRRTELIGYLLLVKLDPSLFLVESKDLLGSPMLGGEVRSSYL